VLDFENQTESVGLSEKRLVRVVFVMRLSGLAVVGRRLALAPLSGVLAGVVSWVVWIAPLEGPLSMLTSSLPGLRGRGEPLLHLLASSLVWVLAERATVVRPILGAAIKRVILLISRVRMVSLALIRTRFPSLRSFPAGVALFCV